MLPLKDNVPTRRFPILTVGLIATNVLVWVVYQDAGADPGMFASLEEGAYYPCEVDGSCPATCPAERPCPNEGRPWIVTAFTSVFMHGGWEHLLGNMLFLWIFGNNVEDTLGRGRFILFYVLGGLAATATQTIVTLESATAAQAAIPNVGASGAIAAVLGAYILLHPGGSVLTWIMPFFFIPIPAVVYLGLWFVFQLVAGSASFTHPEPGGGVAYFAHIGGFVFGFLAIKPFSTGRPRPLSPV